MKLFDYLCCPKCKGKLNTGRSLLICKKCGFSYEIQEGIPILVSLKEFSGQHQKQINYFSHCSDMVETKYKLEEWHKSFLRRFKENFQDLKNKTVLDCGTGQGYMAIELAKKGAIVIACDLTIEWLLRLKKIAKQKGLEKKILFVCCSAEELPIRNKSIDYLVSNALLEHLEKEKEAVSEISRVCKKKAGLMITTPLLYRYLNPLFIPYFFIQDRIIGHLRRYDEKRLASVFKIFKGKLKNAYYTGHFQKVIITKLFTEIFGSEKLAKIGEKIDRKNERNKIGASNICVFFQRN